MIVTLDRRCQRGTGPAAVPEGFLTEERLTCAPGEADQGTVQVTTLPRGSREESGDSGEVTCPHASPAGHLRVAASCPSEEGVETRVCGPAAEPRAPVWEDRRHIRFPCTPALGSRLLS